MGYKHFSHTHELVICSKADYKNAQCKVCDAECTGMTYGCNFKECRFYIHYSCLLPKEFPHAHPAHPPHSLVLRPVSADFTCSTCRCPQSNGFCYLCQDCSFAIDVKCAFPLPAVIYPGHRHQLHFFDELPEDVEHRQCEACRKPCRSSVLCCLDLDCKFGVHLVCERPSCLFKHGYFLGLPWLRCPSTGYLELKASIDEVDVRRCRCRYCLEEMGPQTPLYYCDDCELIAHVKCVFSRVDRDEDLEMMICAEKKQDGREEGNSDAKDAATQQVETFGGMVDSLNDREKAELEDVYKRRVGEIIKVLAWQNNAGGSSDGVPTSPFLDEAFSEFRKKLPCSIPRINSLAVASEDERVVKVAEYTMTQKLAPVLRKLFATHGDLSEESMLTLKPKNLVFIMLCGTIDSMANKKVAEVTEELLYNWWKYLMFVHLSRFKIQFAIDRLKVIMRAHYVDLQDDNNSILRMDIDIRELSKEIEASQSRLDGLNKDRGGMSDGTDENLVEACSKDAIAWEW